jgi:hypothetical protein
MYSFVSLFPELDLGFVVLTNQQSSAARSALMYTVMKPYLGDNSTDWLAKFAPASSKSLTNKQKNNTELNNVLANSTNSDVKQYVGTYEDPWLGQFIIEYSDNDKTANLRIRSLRVEKFVGDLYLQVNENKLLIRWDDRSLEADAVITFKRNQQNEVNGMTLVPASKDIDFSYDFQDLNFTKL